MPITKKQAVFGLILIGILMILSHIPVLNKAPGSVHSWRQCHTLAVAQNFYEEDMNILAPRVDRRGSGSGVTGMQFPSYEFGLALLYKAFGSEFWVHRWYSLVLSFLAVLAMYRIGSLMWESRTMALFVAFLVPWSPDFFYHSTNALPDILALSCGLWAFALTLEWRRSRRYQHIILALLFFTLSGLTKIQYLSLAVPLAVVLIRDLNEARITGKEMIYWIFGAILGSALVLRWYVYAIELREQSKLTDFGLHFNPVTNIGDAALILYNNLTSHIPDGLLNYACFILLLVGILRPVSKSWKREWRLAFTIWLIVLFAYHMIELGQMSDHPYYMYPYLLLLWIVSGEGIRYLLNRGKLGWIVVLLIVVQPVLAFFRIAHRWTQPERYVPFALYDDRSRESLRAIPTNGIPIVGPDHSGSIYFYFLNKAGFGFGDPEDLFRYTNGRKNIDLWIENGAGTLYTDNGTLQNDPRLQPYIERQLECVNGFCVYLLKPHLSKNP
ncbi:MAG: glycosyltransferase family 39 protein [Flavobacteriales bacterium]|nr:glycosyltransferase family 39 protein [Flavobacteriales bacterium]